jgi:hypothetical protein
LRRYTIGTGLLTSTHRLRDQLIMNRARRKEEADRAYQIQVKQGTLVCHSRDCSIKAP